MSALPLPLAVETLDYEAVLAALKADLLERDGTLGAALTLESEPLVKLLEVYAYRELLLRARVNDAYRAAMLAYATGADLDQVGDFHEVARLTGEADAAYRKRIHLGYWRLAAAGPAPAWEAHALGAHANVVEALPSSPASGDVQVVVLAGELVESAHETARQTALRETLFATLPAPPAGSAWELAGMLDAPLAAVRGALTADAVMPLGLALMVNAPQVIDYHLIAALTLYPAADAAAVLADADAALLALLRETARIGYDVTRARLTAALAVPGVQNVRIDSPAADLVCDPGSIALCLSRTLTVAGRDV